MVSEILRPLVCGQKLFTSPGRYFPARYELQPGYPGWAKVLCERTEDSDAIAAHLWPFDAMACIHKNEAGACQGQVYVTLRFHGAVNHAVTS
ncbi:hypothetical protein GCM10011408_09620 [Dyella caseinilytica]|nr:hypothetical protein GCM10011408_09620 [Dyella caseinilytica]